MKEKGTNDIKMIFRNISALKITMNLPTNRILKDPIPQFALDYLWQLVELCIHFTQIEETYTLTIIPNSKVEKVNET